MLAEEIVEAFGLEKERYVNLNWKSGYRPVRLLVDKITG